MRILSWNIQWGRGCDRVVDLDRIAATARSLDDPDVLCLQEVSRFMLLPGGTGEDQVAALAQRFPGFGAHYAAAVDLPGGRGGRAQMGNLILSRLPVLEVFRHSLPWPADPPVPSMPRVALEVVIDATPAPLRIITTHLEYYSAHQRRAQVEALREIWCSGLAHARQPRAGKDVDSPFAVLPRGSGAVICGDFNCEPDSAEHARMIAPFDDDTPTLVDAWFAHGGPPHEPTVGLHGCDWPDRPYCCDYFFVSEPLRGRVRGVQVHRATDASDHQPISLDLET